MSEGPRRRLQLLCTLLVGLLIVIVAQLFKVQVVDHEFYLDWARHQREREITIAKSPRGLIRDRNGDLLVGNTITYDIGASTEDVNEEGLDQDAAKLAAVLHMPAAHIRRLLMQKNEENWVWLARSTSREVAETVTALHVPNVGVESRWRREYPEGPLASHVLGFCNADVSECFCGVEEFYDVALHSEPITWTGSLDSGNDQIPWAVAPVELPEPGETLVLTLDRGVQALVEEALAEAVAHYQAEGGTIIVMDPRTFGILALAGIPDYNPATPYAYADQPEGPFASPAVSKQYEPGSVFKVLTVAAALDSGTVTPGTTYHDQGVIEVGGEAYRNASRQAYGQQTIDRILIKSLNVGSAWLGVQMGPDTFYRYLQRFGIGERTEVDLADEVTGKLWTPADIGEWDDSLLGANAFGQGVAVTPMQMISAIATVANDGERLRPHVVAQRITADGAVSNYQAAPVARVISPEVADQVTDMLVRAVEEEIEEAHVPGYRVAGKTGTAEIPVPGGYTDEETIVTFVGYGPVPDPSLVVLVKLDRPKASHWAHDTAAPTFGRLMGQLFNVMGVPPHGLAVAEAME